MKRAVSPARKPDLDITYTAFVCGSGRVLPIVESIGRRVVRQIDAEGSEGRRLLARGQVRLWPTDRRGSIVRPTTKISH